MSSASAVELRPADGGSRRSRWVFDARHNSLNLIRLVLATSVIVSHAYPLAGRGDGPFFAGTSLGGWAVVGFFAISGYLIMGSRMRTTFGTYLTHRIARIFPGFLACLVLTAFVLAPVAYTVENGTISGFLTTPNTPANYVFGNALLRISDYTVAGTLQTVPYPGAWNGSLWSLYFEFLCYLVVGLLACFSFFRRTRWAIVAAFVVSVFAQALLPYVLRLTGSNGDATLLVKLLPFFLAGALVHRFRDSIPLTAPVALGGLAIFLVTTWFVPSWGSQATAPLLVVGIFWIAKVLPSPAWVRRHDISYGVYVYAFPMQQMLALAGVHEAGQLVYVLAAVPPTYALAAASWFLLERRVMERAKRAGRPPTPNPTPTPSTEPVPVVERNAA